MKPGAYLINNSRGTVVDLDALAVALREGRLRGAAIDVFPARAGVERGGFVSPLQGLANVILTPHIGGSTEEAQERIGEEVARKLIDYSDNGSTIGAVNFPQAQLPPRPRGTRFIQVQRNLPGMLGQAQRCARPPCGQHRRAILRDARRDRLCRARRRRFRRRQPAGARRHPGAGGHDPRAAGVRGAGLAMGRRSIPDEGNAARGVFKPTSAGRLRRATVQTLIAWRNRHVYIP